MPSCGRRGVARRFGAQVALEPTDIDVRVGETLALIGPNGAGKSTLLSLLSGALEPSTGRIEHVNGVRVGWVPQPPAFYDRLTARENLELFARLEREGDPVGIAGRLLARFDVPANRPAQTLSVGNRQRLNVTALREEDGSVVFATQNLEELDLYADRVAILQRGRLTFVGSAAEYDELHVEEVFSLRVCCLF